MKRRADKDEIAKLRSTIAKQNETIKFLLKRIETLKALYKEAKHG